MGENAVPRFFQMFRVEGIPGSKEDDVRIMSHK
jgi:hypothetical protein